MRFASRASSLLAAVVALAASATECAVVRVAPTGADVFACGSVASPCASFRYALQQVAARGDTIELAAGTYVDSGATIEFDALPSFGGITITAAAGTTPTTVTIDRAYSGRLFVFKSGAGQVRFTGVRFFRGGWADADTTKDYSGALMQFYSADADVEFTNCVFEASRNPNKGYGGRGGVAAILAGAPRFTNCLFTANWAGVASAIYSSGMSAPVFDACTFEHSGCFAGGWGGAVVPEEQSAGVWKNSVFRNISCDYGGAVDDGGTATPQFINCTFESNFGGTLGGAYYGFGNTQTKFVGCRFFRNRVGKGGVGQDYYLSSSVSSTFENCLFDAGPDPVQVSDGASGACKDNSTLTMVGSTVKGYRAAFSAVLLSVEARGSFEATVFAENECVRGGAVGATGKPVFIKNCTFLNNVANEGGAVMLISLASQPNVVLDSRFEGNVAKGTGGAIKMSGQSATIVAGCTFKANSAKGTGGGAIYVASDSAVTVNASTFEGNYASSGGAIWSEGALRVTRSTFRRNYLHIDDESAGDACSVEAGTGAAIYSSLAPAVQIARATDATTSSTCTMSQLQLDTLTFDANNASVGGGGGIFLDGRVPECVNSTQAACQSCTFSGNDAAYGKDVATVVSALQLRSASAPSAWVLMGANDVAIGAADMLGQDLRGSHAPLLVRIRLLDRDASGDANASAPASTAVSLTTNILSRTIRGGEAVFKALALRLAAGQVNTVARPLALSFTSDTGVKLSRGAGVPLTLLVLITLDKCPQENGLLNADGSCLVEATGGTDKVIAGIIFSAVVGGSFLFALYWSYKNSNRVMHTIQHLVTGVGSIVIKFVFELLDIASDAQALVNLFLFDVTLSHPTFVRVAYVTCFALAVPPSVLLIHATLHNIRAQWKRTKSKSPVKVLAHRGANAATERSMLSMNEDAAQLNGKVSEQTPGECCSIQEPEKTPTEIDDAMLQTHTTRVLVDRYIRREIRECEQELEYYRTRATLMKRMLARLVVEDLLLLSLNVYIYVANHADELFLKSKFRSSLELSIFLSAVNFGSQAQTIVTWLQVNKVGEIARNMETLKKLKARVEGTPTTTQYQLDGVQPQPTRSTRALWGSTKKIMVQSAVPSAGGVGHK